jgi:hypothetical protein
MTLSETWALDAPRYLVSMTECDDVRSVLARLLKDCRAKTSTGVRVAAPVLAEPETEQLLQANVGVHRAKQGTQPSGPLIASTTVPLIEAKPSPSSAEEAPSPAGAPTPLAGADSGDDRARFVRTQARARSLWRQSKASEKLDQSLVRDIQVMLDTADALADGGHLAEATADYERVIDSLEAPRS